MCDNIWHVSFHHISVLWVETEHLDKVHVRFHLTDTPNLQKNTVNMLSTDPASQLAVSIEGCNSNGREFHVFLRTEERINIFKTNVLVDVLEGLRFEESQKLPR